MTRSTVFDPGEPDDPELPEGEASEYLLSYTLTVGDIVFTGKEISSVSAGFRALTWVCPGYLLFR